jgi:Tol biopolymer transport system component
VEWHPEGELLAIGALSPGSTYQVVIISLDGSMEPERPIPTDGRQLPLRWTPDRKLLYRQNDPETGTDIWEMTLGEAPSTRALIREPSAQTSPTVSPDMRWLAYTSFHSGQAEVWVRPYDGPGRPVMASHDGGEEPLWAPDGLELYFRKGEQVLAVEIFTEPRLSAGTPRVLFEGRYVRNNYRAYDLAPDGEHFVMIKEGERWGTRLEVVANWFEKLKELVPRER